MKRIISILLSAFLLCHFITISSIATTYGYNSISLYQTDGGYICELFDTGSAYLHLVQEENVVDGVLQVPESVTYSGKEYKVTGFITGYPSDDEEVFVRRMDNNGFDTLFNVQDYIRLYEKCDKIVLPDTVESVVLDVFGTKEHPVTVVLGKNTTRIQKENHSHGKNSKNNLYQYIAFDTSRNEHFSAHNNLLIYEGNTVVAALGAEEKYIIPKTIEKIESTAFKDCISMEKLTFQKRNKDIYIGPDAFAGSNSLKELTVPAYLSEKSIDCFAGLKGLTKIKFASRFKKKSLPSGAFKGCTAMEFVKLPESLEKVSSRLFYSCTALKKVKLGKNIKVIERWAFDLCESLEKIKFPKKLKEIETSPFTKCKMDINLPKSCTKIEGIKGYSGKKVTVNGAVKVIKKSTFARCENLEEVNFKGKYLSTFGDYVFYKNENLKKITISNTKKAPTFTKKTFKKAAKGIKFYVKNKTVAKKLFKNLRKAGYTTAKIYVDGKRYK